MGPILKDQVKPMNAAGNCVQPNSETIAYKNMKGGVLVIDDDATFGLLMKAVAEARGIKLDYVGSLAELGSFARIGDYDVAVLDYYLEKLTGAEIAEYFDAFFQDKPVIIVSGSSRLQDDSVQWPKCVRKFVLKSNGARNILDNALEAWQQYDEAR